MNKLILFLLVGCFVLVSWLSEKRKPACLSSPLYLELSKEQWRDIDQEKKLNLIVGIDYLPYEFVEIFEELTGIKVVVDVFDSNEILEAKMLAGGSRYDLVFPTAWPNFFRQLSAQVYQPLDKSKIDFSKFDKVILDKLEDCFSGEDAFCVPYQFGISGIGLDESVIDRVLPNVDKDSLGIFLNPKNAEILSNERFCVYDSPEELFPAILAYLGLDPETTNEDDIIKAAEHLKKLRPYIYKFTSFGFEDLSSGDVALTLGTSGDIVKVQQNSKRPQIKFFCPKEGAALWVDVIAIPKRAQHLKNIYTFLRFLFHPKVISAITNKTYRANCVKDAKQYVANDIVNNENIYPSADFCKKCYIERPVPACIEKLRTRLLTKIKSMM
ncbi:MAG: extracellular solute-binding protein [Alphaproteobacteria bacterium]|nr:extracellular solute-binding protein [Alphaproteobacteria bacterium]